MKRFRIWPILTGVATIAAILLVVLVAKSRGGRDEKFDPSLVAKISRGDLEIAVTELGKIVPREQVGVKSKVAGQVQKLLVDEGDKVKAGQLLMVLDPIDFQRNVMRAQQEVQKAVAAVEFAELTLGRRQKGLSDRGVAQADVDFAENDLKTKKIGLAQAKESLAISEDQLRFSRITAPLDGTITQRVIRVGETVVPGSVATFDGAALMTLSDLSVLIAKAELNKIEGPRVRLGRKGSRTWAARRAKTYTPTITKIAPASILPKGKDVEVFPIEATLDAASPEIKPGMTADVKIQVETKKGVLKLPIEAVVKEKGKSYVNRLEEDGKKTRTVKVEVQVGARSDRDQEIVSGINEGDRVLIKPPSADANEFK